MGWLGTKPRLIWLTEKGVVRGGYRMICRQDDCNYRV